ncbi:aminotransferase class V-fold PLP-dependent enzyme, partial [Caulobacter sp.]|uniref:aminotransferase class V-fold PLP-dependent enzyme n=1 Tax=Caulobacter sp. TaxID=78 RepID=UPI002B4A13AA
MAFDAPFDVAAIRAQFPILQRTVHGKPLVYLDSAASAQKPDVVLDAMTDLARTSYANVHRGLHTLANETTEAYEKARETVAKFINADRDEVVWTKSATEAVNLVASSFGLSLNA